LELLEKYSRYILRLCQPMRTVCEFSRDDFHLDDQPCSGRSSGIDNDIMRNLECRIIHFNRISTEKIAKRVNIDRSIVFRHLKKIRYTLKLDMLYLLTKANKLNRVFAAFFYLAN